MRDRLRVAWWLSLILAACGGKGHGGPSNVDAGSDAGSDSASADATTDGDAAASDTGSDSASADATTDGDASDVAADASASPCTVSRFSLGAQVYGLPFLAWTGSDVLVLWDDLNAGIKGVRRGPDASTAGAAWVAPQSLFTGHAAFAWGGSTVGVLFSNLNPPAKGDMTFATLDANGGPVLAPTRIADPATANWSELLAWNGSSFAAAWRAGSATTYVFTEIAPDGTVRYAPTAPGGTGNQAYVSPDERGGWWWTNVAASLASDLTIARIGSGGAVAASQVAHDSQLLISPWIASGPAGTFLAYGNNDDERLHLHAVDATTAALAADKPLQMNVFSPTIALAWGGDRLGLAWYALDHSAGKTTISFVELDSSGNMRGAPTAISTLNEGADVEGQITPNWLIWTGTRWVIAWIAHRDTNDLMLSTVTCP